MIRGALRLALLPALLLAVGACAPAPSDRSAQPTTNALAARPNLLVLVTDDQRWDAVGYENPRVETPHIDRLAARGVRFDNAFVTTTICPASRASILTGRLEREHGHTFGTPPLDPGLVASSYPALLRDSGYETAYVGKLGVELGAGAPTLFDHHVELWRRPYFQPDDSGTLRHVTELTARAAVDFLEGRDPSRPFALTVAFNAPHADDREEEQYLWPDAVDGLYRDVVFPPPPLAEPEFFAAQPGFLRDSKNRERWQWRFDTPEKYQRMVAGYLRMVSGVDRAVGEIADALDRLGLTGDTVILFTSDNGYFLGDRGFAGKWLGYDAALRVPLFLHDPRDPRAGHGRRSRALALNVDLAPTLLDLAGLEPPESMSGRSLLDALPHRPADWRRDFFFEQLYVEPGIPRHEGVRTGQFKYVRYLDQEPPYEELFDLGVDPDESRNLAADPTQAGRLEALRGRCDELARHYESRRVAPSGEGS